MTMETPIWFGDMHVDKHSFTVFQQLPEDDSAEV